MKMIIVLAAVLAMAVALPFDASKTAQVLKYENDNIGVDGYKYAFETSDGISKIEQGELKTYGPETHAVIARGSFSYVGDDGVTYTVNYTADENGFQPEGSHLPVAPV